MNYRPVINPEFEHTSPIPVPDSLSQLFTGEPFKKNAPWASVQVIPDASYMTHVNLRSANPPIQALYQMTYPNRPGNNSSLGNIPGISVFTGDDSFGRFNIPCMPCIKKVQCDCEYSCGCKDGCANNNVPKCPCKEGRCPIKYVEIN